MGHLRAEPGLLARGRPLTPKTRPRRRAEYSDDAVAWPARARHDRLPALNLRRRSRFGPGQLPIKRSLAHARSRVDAGKLKPAACRRNTRRPLALSLTATNLSPAP